MNPVENQLYEVLSSSNQKQELSANKPDMQRTRSPIPGKNSFKNFLKRDHKSANKFTSNSLDKSGDFNSGSKMSGEKSLVLSN